MSERTKMDRFQYVSFPDTTQHFESWVETQLSKMPLARGRDPIERRWRVAVKHGDRILTDVWIYAVDATRIVSEASYTQTVVALDTHGSSPIITIIVGCVLVTGGLKHV